MNQASERLLGLVNADNVVVPGHGVMRNRQSLPGVRDMLRTIEDRVQSLLASHSSVDEISDATLTLDFDEIGGEAMPLGKSSSA
jgi:hypothetical protein